MLHRSRGFTLLETAIALAIAVLLGMLLMRTTAEVLRWSALQAQRDSEHAQIGELADRLESEEDSAWAIFTPPKDVNGASNADGHEVDFFTRDGKNRAYFWAYTYDPATGTLTRSTYSAPGSAPQTDITYSGINAFYAHTYPVTDLQNTKSKIYSPLYAGATLAAGSVPFYSGTDVVGGNAITFLRIVSPTLVRELQLSTLTAPSGFVVVLQYTPTPTSTPQATLQSWPQYIELPMQGQALQSSAARRSAIGFASLSSCGTDQGRAFTDATFSTPLTDATAPAGYLPPGVSGSTDASGCITLSSPAFTSGMPNVALSQRGFTGTFTQPGNNCGAAVKLVNAYGGNAFVTGSTNGPAAEIVSQGGSSAIATCAMTWQGGSAAQEATITYEVTGCVTSGNSGNGVVPVGSNCTVSAAPWPNDGPSCVNPINDPGGIANGYNGTGFYSLAGDSTGTPNSIVTTDGYGSIVTNGDGTVTFSRTSPGTVTITAFAGYTSYQYNSLTENCSPHNSWNAYVTWTIN